jgi:hypothetical protein
MRVHRRTPPAEGRETEGTFVVFALFFLIIRVGEGWLGYPSFRRDRGAGTINALLVDLVLNSRPPRWRYGLLHWVQCVDGFVGL